MYKTNRRFFKQTSAFAYKHFDRFNYFWDILDCNYLFQLNHKMIINRLKSY